MTPDLRGFELDRETGASGGEPGNGISAVLEVLGQAFGVAAEHGAPGARQHTWLDTFDWRLYRAGLVLEYEHARRGGRLLLSKNEVPQAEQPVDGWQPSRPRLATDLPAGPVRDQIVKLASPRALLPMAAAVGTVTVTRLINADGKTVARLIVDHSTVTRGDQTVPLPARLAITEVRGYPGQARKAAQLVAGTPGVSPAGKERVRDGPGRPRPPPGRLLGRRDRGDHRGDARPRRGRHLAAGPARHPGAERRRHAPRHRHRVPARPAGGGPPHPVGDQAAERHATGRPGRAVRGRVQVARRPDHADPGPRRPPGRFRRDGRGAGGRVAGRPRAVPRLPGPAPRAGGPAAGLRAALGPVPDHHRPLAQGADRGPGRAPAPEGILGSSPPTNWPWPGSARTFRRVAARSPRSPRPRLAIVHHLRKRCKELRYALEFFAPLHDPVIYRKVVGDLKQLQDCLGEFQDSQVQREEIHALADAMLTERAAPAATLLAMGEVAANLALSQAEAREVFAGRFTRFAGPAGQERVRALLARPKP